MATDRKVGDRLSYEGALCTVRYIGPVSGTAGSWLGVEWDDPARGRHDGSHKGVRYFTCLSNASTAASFVRPARPAETAQSFVAAVYEKYASEPAKTTMIKFSNKVAEEVGFEKIHRKQAQLGELKYVIVDGACIVEAYAAGEEPIRQVCPKIVELDLSRNLFQTVGAVVGICSELAALRSLRLNGNRFQDVTNDGGLEGAESALGGVKDLALEETLLSWPEICHVAAKFTSLSALSASANQLTALPAAPLAGLASTLVSLSLEFNNFTALADVASLAGLTSLRNLHLKGNRIAAVTRDASDAAPVLSESLRYLDLSYNAVASWAFVDALPACFPGLASLRFSHNPVYDDPDPGFSARAQAATEEAYMFTVGRLAGLRALNFGTVSAADRQDAEMFYLGRIAKHLAAVPAGREAEVLAQHRRYAELCALYGAPAVNRRAELNPAFLEARLVTVRFALRSADGGAERTARIPKSFDIYAVKGIAGKLFGARPLGLRLVWETGEWDPVAGFDDEVEDSSDEEQEDREREQHEEEAEAAAAAQAKAKAADLGEGSPQDSGSRTGKWVKREVELHDGPRQLGFCVDGLEANIRVEFR